MIDFATLPFPARLDLAGALAFAGECHAIAPDCAIVLLDFSAFSWAEPFGMLIAAQALRQLKARGGINVMPTGFPGNDAEGYATHVGFFEACDIPLKKPHGDAKGSSIYLPIKRVENPGLLHGRDIETISLDLAKQLTQQTSGELIRTLTYAFTEVIRNVAEHARSPEYWFCAQYWQSRGTAEIALLDVGIGLRASLSNNPYVRDHLTTDENVLKYALMPGISGKKWGKSRDTDDEWTNSGYGLYMNYRICDEGGSFFIASGGKGLLRRKDAPNQYYDYHLPGVALRLKMQVDVMQHFDDRLRQQFLADAMHQASQIEGGIVPTGDKMSQMLRTGFAPTRKEDQ